MDNRLARRRPDQTQVEIQSTWVRQRQAEEAAGLSTRPVLQPVHHLSGGEGLQRAHDGTIEATEVSPSSVNSRRSKECTPFRGPPYTYPLVRHPDYYASHYEEEVCAFLALVLPIRGLQARLGDGTLSLLSSCLSFEPPLNDPPDVS